MPNIMRILIIEDHEPSAIALAKVLTKRMLCPIECSFATNLEDGLKIAVELNADITILDPGLPDCTREEAARSISFFPPPVIVVTDFEDDSSGTFERLCYENNAANYLQKHELRSTILQREGAKLVSAITKAHWRSTLPTAEVRARHMAALSLRCQPHVQTV